MRNPKKTLLPQRKPSLQIKKAISVLKCFICNQMFYSQLTFDQHMRSHSSKLSRNIPQQIQRKTMQSFRVKKNQTMTNIGFNKQKRILNQTATIMTVNKQQEQRKKQIIDQFGIQEQFKKQDKERVQDTLRSSTILIRNIQQIIKQPLQEQSQIQAIVKQESTPQIMKEQISQQQLINKITEITKNNQNITTRIKEINNLILRAKLIDQYLISCKDQLAYLQQMQRFLQSNINKDKITKTRQIIVQAIMQHIKINLTIQKPNSMPQQQQIQCTYLTDLKSKPSPKNNKNSPIQQKQLKLQMIQNSGIGICSSCYSEIDYGQYCYQQKQNKKQKFNQQTNLIKYHIECWEQQLSQKQLNK